MHCQQRALLLLLAALLLAPASGASGGVCVDAPQSSLCLNWTVASGSVTFSAACAPPPGMSTTYWCAFGLSTAGADMFPSTVAAVQSAGGGVFYVEDRDSFIGYRSPPCYATQISRLLSASLAGGALLASWTRPLNVSAALHAQHYQDIRLGPAGMTLIAASSSDTSAATRQCNPDMQLHTYCVPGVQVVFE
jgi:hypothetical protein